jgi:hypothetical protein
MASSCRVCMTASLAWRRAVRGGEMVWEVQRPRLSAAAMLDDSELRETSSAAAVCNSVWFGHCCYPRPKIN